MESFDELKSSDPDIYEYIRKELERQREGLEMIPSENFTSLSVLEASGSVLTNKYSEGYAGKRYYGGNEYIDGIERIAIERAKKLFNVVHVNVQPYSGSPANLAVSLAVCKVGDTVMGLNLLDGGHLTHGWKTSVTGQLFNSVPYHVGKDGYIDLDEVRQLAQEHKPKLIWVGATAYSREFPFEQFAKIADSVDAYLAADIAHIAGLIAGGVHKSPSEYVHIITTTTHKTLRGPRGAMAMVTEKGLRRDPELAEKIDKTIFPGMQGGPHDHTTAGIAVALLEASQPKFKEYARQVVTNASVLAKSLMENGITIVTSGTENHLILIDLTPFGNGLGLFAQEALSTAGITVNKNTIPNDPASPFYPSGVRLGTPAITTRGMKEGEMNDIGKIMADAIMEIKDCRMPEDKTNRLACIKDFKVHVKENEKLAELRVQVLDLCKRFPLYAGLEM